MQVQGLADGRGLRPINATRLRSSELAETYAGLPDGVTKHLILDWIRDASSSSMGLGRAAKRVLRCLVDVIPPAAFLQRGQATGEWNEHLGLVCFLSNRALADDLEIGVEAVRKLLKQLADRGWISFKDSATRKRFAIRDKATGQICSAFGIDLRPLCSRIDELMNLAQASELELGQIRDLQRNVSGLFNRLRVFAAHPEFGSHFVDQDEVLRLADRLRKSRNLVALQNGFEVLIARLAEIEAQYLELASMGLLEGESRGEPLDLSSQRTPTLSSKNLSEEGVSYESEEAAGAQARFEEAVIAEEAGLRAMAADGVPAMVTAGERPSPANVRLPGMKLLLETFPHVLERGGGRFYTDRLFEDPRRVMDGYANAAASHCGLSRAEIEDCRQIMGDQGFRVVALIGRYKDDVRNRRAYILALRSRFSLAQLAPDRAEVLLDLNRTWFGLYRWSLGSKLN